MKNDKPIVAIVVPCFNEKEALPETILKLTKKILNLIEGQIISDESKILFVDDGSTDNTWKIIEENHLQNTSIISGIKLSKNQGHQNALLCGLHSVTGFFDAAISIDADLQDDIDVIDNMISKYKEGFEIVYGVRSNRKTDTLIKRYTAQSFYKFLSFLGVNIVYNHADFRLLGRNALEALSEYSEINLFLRGIIPLLGFKTTIEYYKRTERLAGKSKYPFKKMFVFAVEGITSFSIKPIRFITFLGILIFITSIVMIIHFFIRHYTGHTVSGWSSIVCSIWGIGGLILFSIGIIGEYIGKIYLETKQRPRYHIEKSLFIKEQING